jgi:hypothetical protein
LKDDRDIADFQNSTHSLSSASLPGVTPKESHHSLGTYLPGATPKEKELRETVRFVPIEEPELGRIPVSACGRQLELEAQDVQPLATLQASLRRDLCIQGQDLDIFDVHGNRISFDSDLMAALNRGDFPLSASMPDSSTARTEHKREDLSHMQWMLIRDQLSGLGDKIAKIGRSVEELSEFVSVQRRDNEATANRLRHEMNSLIDSHKDISRHSILQLSERIDELSQSIHPEESVKEAEVFKQTVEKQIQSVYDELEDVRRHRNEGTSEGSLVEEMQRLVQDQEQARSALEDSLQQEIRRLGERIDLLGDSQSEKAHDVNEQILQASNKSIQDVEDIAKHVMQAIGTTDTWQTHRETRIQSIEVGSWKIERSLTDAMNEQGSQFDQVWQRLEKLCGTMEQVRLDAACAPDAAAPCAITPTPTVRQSPLPSQLPADSPASTLASSPTLGGSGAVASLAAAVGDWKRRRAEQSSDASGSNQASSLTQMLESAASSHVLGGMACSPSAPARPTKLGQV